MRFDGAAGEKRGGAIPRGGLALVSALLVLLCFGVAGASAFTTRLVQDRFQPAGGFAQFGDWGVAVNQDSGAVYVGDVNGGSVYVFGADGTPAGSPKLTEADGVTPASFEAARGIAVDGSGGATAGDIYVADSITSEVRQFDPSGAATAQAPITVASIPADGTPQTGTLPNVVNNGKVELNGVATDSTGNVYVTDSSNEVVDVFTSTGTFVSQLGLGVLASPKWVAVAPSGDLYVSQSSGPLKLSPDGECLNSCETLSIGAIAGIATDSAGHVYAAEFQAIYEFNSAGEQISKFGMPTDRPNFGGLGYTAGVAVNSTSGAIYAADLIPSDFQNNVASFGPLVKLPTVTTGAAENITPVSATLEGTVDPDGEALTECLFEYGPTPQFGTKVPCAESLAAIGSGSGEVSVHADLTGLNPDDHFFFRLAAGNANGAARFPEAEFLTPPTVAITPEAATENSGRSVQLNALVNDRGLALSACAFEYVTDDEYQAAGGRFPTDGTIASVPCDPAAATIPADTSDHPVSAQVSGLVGNTAYHFRVSATNANGPATMEGPEFTTPQTAPIVATGTATELELTSAKLQGLVNPAGLATTYYFEYGTSVAYGSKLPAADAEAGEGRLAVAVTQAATGLQPSTTYHFRLVAVNAVGTETGADATFSTRAPAIAVPVVPPPAGSGETPTPVKKKTAHKGRCAKHHHKKGHGHKGRARAKGRCGKKAGGGK